MRMVGEGGRAGEPYDRKGKSRRNHRAKGSSGCGGSGANDATTSWCNASNWISWKFNKSSGTGTHGAGSRPTGSGISWGAGRGTQLVIGVRTIFPGAKRLWAGERGERASSANHRELTGQLITINSNHQTINTNQ